MSDLRYAIQDQMARAIHTGCGANVEVTDRGHGRFTLNGSPAHVSTAVRYLTSHRLMAEESRVHDDEVGETFAYMKETTTTKRRRRR